MPAIETQNAAPSTLTDLLGQVRDVFDAIGDATPILIGGAFPARGVGSGPHVLFVLEPRGAGGALGSALVLGNPASQTHACDVHIRAAETGDDLTRFDEVYRLSDLVVDLVQTAGAGRVKWGPCFDGSPLGVDSGIGAGLSYGFTYQRDIRHDARRWKGAPRGSTGPLEGPLTAPTDDSPPVLSTSPAATRGTVSTITITTTAEE